MPNSKTARLGLQGKLLISLLVAAVVPFGILAAEVGVSALQSVGGLVAGVSLAMGLLIAWGLCLGFIRQADAIDETLREINDGNFEARVDVLSQDQLGTAADSLNVMCDNTLNLLQSHNETGDVQASIENLITQVESIAAGDLTISAEVNSNITGAIAGSVNHMTAQLRSIVQQVKTATEQVNHSAANIRQSSTGLSCESDQQAREISEASHKLVAMTRAFRDVVSRTEESVNVAVEARQTASAGLKAVTDTVEGMQRIRAQVQNTSKRIKRLGESSQEIGEIVKLISDIADRTSILALNASIQAAMAGDAGHGFAVVAEEVEHLAERSAAATGQIACLIRGIQMETGEVISDMEESTREVVAGSRLASEAGETLFEIDSVSNQLVELIESVSASARSQADDASQVASTMEQISLRTRESAEKSRRATQSVNELAQMADELRESVSRFHVDRPPHGAASGKSPASTAGRPAGEAACDGELMDQLREVSRMMDAELQDDEEKSPQTPEAPARRLPVTPTLDANRLDIPSTISSTMMMPEDE
jgi:methyl-accepting chemotaxis protein